MEQRDNTKKRPDGVRVNGVGRLLRRGLRPSEAAVRSRGSPGADTEGEARLRTSHCGEAVGEGTLCEAVLPLRTILDRMGKTSSAEEDAARRPRSPALL